ncbi:hypothetical protein MD484_g7752, partial [Candolleomyces efflorescens]
MRSNFISVGFVFLSVALQASAAPLPKSAHNFERSLELDLSEIDNRHFGLDDIQERSPGLRETWQSVKNGVKKVVSSPTFQAIGSAVVGAAVDKGVNAVFSGRRHKRSLELDLSELDNRDLDLEDFEARDPGFRETWQKVKQGAGRVVNSPVFQAVGSIVAGAAIDKGVDAVFSGRRHGRRSLELDLSELDNRDFDFEDFEERDPGFREVWQKVKSGANQVVQSPIFQAVGSAVAGAAIDRGVNAVFNGRRHGRRSVEEELDDLAVRDPGFREVWQKVKSGANQVVQSPIFQAVGSAVAGAAIDKGVNAVFNGRRHGRRSLEEELDELAVRDPGFREVWQKVKNGAKQVVQSPIFQAVGSAVAGAAIDKGVNAVFSGRRHGRRSLEVHLPAQFGEYWTTDEFGIELEILARALEVYPEIDARQWGQ